MVRQGQVHPCERARADGLREDLAQPASITPSGSRLAAVAETPAAEVPRVFGGLGAAQALEPPLERVERGGGIDVQPEARHQPNQVIDLRIAAGRGQRAAA
jgi:hypothetical protein